MEWFTADTHFQHANILSFGAATRGHFTNIREHDDGLIRNWNERVSPNDTVYHLGDFGYGSAARSIEILSSLNGHKILVPGNHDKKLLNNGAFVRLFDQVAPYSYLEISIKGQSIVLSHFPIWEWWAIHYGAIHLHGHVHGTPTGIPGKIMDVGVDAQGLAPVSFDEVMAIMDTKPLRRHK